VDVDQFGAGIVAVEEPSLERSQISGRQLLKLDLGPAALGALENERREPPVALEVVGVSAALGQLTRRATRRLNSV